jgi:hypothetical protein
MLFIRIKSGVHAYFLGCAKIRNSHSVQLFHQFMLHGVS